MMGRMASILPFRRRKTESNPEATACGQTEPLDTMSGTSGRDLTSRPSRPPAPVAPVTTQGEAAKAFFEHMQFYAGGCTLQMRWVEQAYRQLSVEYRWMPMSTKALSMHLVAMGCRRHRERNIEGERLTLLTFPAVPDD